MSQHPNLYLAPPSADLRDAIHVPIISGVAGNTMSSGDHVKYVPRFNKWYACDCTESQGICNPFNTAPIRSGELVWVMIPPAVITDLKHVWSHPDFPFPEVETVKAGGHTAEQKAASEAWLRNFCNTADCPRYDIMIKAAVGDSIDCVDDDYYGTYSIENYGDGEEYLFFSGRDVHGGIPPEFWDHVEVVTGRTCPARPSHFSCSC